jgi:hypothetical protein
MISGDKQKMMDDMIARMNKENAQLKKELNLGSDDEDPDMKELHKQLKKPRKQNLRLLIFK